MAVTKNLVNIGDACISGDLEANKIVKRGGTSSQFLMADGSVNSNTYSTTDTKVTQTNTTDSSDYRVLFSSTSNDSTLTEGARKSAKLKFNPSTGVLTVTGTVNASTGFFQTSDIRKKNIKEELSLEKSI